MDYYIITNMNKNFTPLDHKKWGIKEENHFESTFNTVLLLLATITALIASIVLFLLIQKQIKGYG